MILFLVLLTVCLGLYSAELLEANGLLEKIREPNVQDRQDIAYLLKARQFVKQ